MLCIFRIRNVDLLFGALVLSLWSASPFHVACIRAVSIGSHNCGIWFDLNSALFFCRLFCNDGITLHRSGVCYSIYAYQTQGPSRWPSSAEGPSGVSQGGPSDGWSSWIVQGGSFLLPSSGSFHSLAISASKLFKGSFLRLCNFGQIIMFSNLYWAVLGIQQATLKIQSSLLLVPCAWPATESSDPTRALSNPFMRHFLF